MSLELLKQISIQSESKIVLLVIDGLGGLPDSETGRTELETAEPWKTFTGRLTK